MVLTSVMELVAFTVEVLGVTIMVSSSSSETSEIDVKTIEPVVEPATISISGEIWTLTIRWLDLSDM